MNGSAKVRWMDGWMDKWEVPKLILAKKVNLSVIYLGFWPISIFDNMESRDCYSLTWFCGA